MLVPVLLVYLEAQVIFEIFIGAFQERLVLITRVAIQEPSPSGRPDMKQTL